jgi:hypothetical protein
MFEKHIPPIWQQNILIEPHLGAELDGHCLDRCFCRGGKPSAGAYRMAAGSGDGPPFSVGKTPTILKDNHLQKIRTDADTLWVARCLKFQANGKENAQSGSVVFRLRMVVTTARLKQ